MKYIVMALADKEEIFVFPRTVEHKRMLEACNAIRFGNESNWKRLYREWVCLSAGFINNGTCHGRSEALNLSSREKEDTLLLKTAISISS